MEAVLRKHLLPGELLVPTKAGIVLGHSLVLNTLLSTPWFCSIVFLPLHGSSQRQQSEFLVHKEFKAGPFVILFYVFL